MRCDARQRREDEREEKGDQSHRADGRYGDVFQCAGALRLLIHERPVLSPLLTVSVS
jgi:hypothetical protein